MNILCETCVKPADLVCFCSKLYFCTACVGVHLTTPSAVPHRPAALGDFSRLIELSLAKLNQSESEILEKAAKEMKARKLLSTRLQNEVMSVDQYYSSVAQNLRLKFDELKNKLDSISSKLLENFRSVCENVKSQLHSWEDLLETDTNFNSVIKVLSSCSDLHEMGLVDLTTRSFDLNLSGFEDFIKNSVVLNIQLKTSKSASFEDSPNLTESKVINTEESLEDDSFAKLRFSVNNLDSRYSKRYTSSFYPISRERKSLTARSSTLIKQTKSTIKETPKYLVWVDKISECLLSYNLETAETLNVFIPHKSQELEGSVWCFTNDGSLVLTGGLAQASRRQTLIIDNSNGITFSGNMMISGRYHHAMVCVNNFLYAIGGSNGTAIRECEKYNVLTNAWQKIGNLNVAREYLSACFHRGRIYVAGGEGADSIEIYNTVSNRFSLLRVRLPSPCKTLMASVDEQMIIFQGKQVIGFDPVKMSIVELAETAEENWYSPVNPLVYKGKIYFVKKANVFSFDLKENFLRSLVILT